MDSAKINDWVQIIGIFALVASLVFVGFQIKQTHEIAESDAYQSRASTSIELSAMRASSPDFTSAMAKIYAGNSDELTPQEEVTVEYFFGALITMLENHHFQVEAGYLPDEHWEKNLNELRCELSLPLFREMIDYWEWRPSFKAVIDEIKADVVTNPIDCWK